MDKENNLMLLKSRVDLLIDGIDPKTKLQFTEDTILLSKFNKSILKEISELLSSLIETGVDVKKLNGKLKYPFHMSEESKRLIELSKEPIPISTFVYKINSALPSSSIRKLKATQITGWLLNEGYLEETIHEDGKVFKILTEKASEIGMTSKRMCNDYGREYDINLYSEQTQKFIVANLEKISS